VRSYQGRTRLLMKEKTAQVDDEDYEDVVRYKWTVGTWKKNNL